VPGKPADDRERVFVENSLAENSDDQGLRDDRQTCPNAVVTFIRRDSDFILAYEPPNGHFPKPKSGKGELALYYSDGDLVHIIKGGNLRKEISNVCSMLK
jgi:hypothetical protein